MGWNRIPKSEVTGAPLIGARMPPTLAAPLLPRLSTRLWPRLGHWRFALRPRIEAAEPAVALLERIAVDVEGASVQADVDDPARRFRLVAEVALEEDADRLVGLQRRLQVGEAGDELDRFANDVLRHAVAKPRAIDAVRNAVAHPNFRGRAGIVDQLGRNVRLGPVAIISALAERDGPDILAALEDGDLLRPVVAGRVESANRQRDAARRQGLHAELLGRGALDRPRALLGKAVGDEEIADLLGDDRLQDRVENLRLPLRAARVDLDLVAVGAGRGLWRPAGVSAPPSSSEPASICAWVCSPSASWEFMASWAASASASCPASGK